MERLVEDFPDNLPSPEDISESAIRFSQQCQTLLLCGATPHPSASALMEQARVSMDAEEAATINSTINEEVVEAERDRLMDDEVEMDVVGMLFSRRGSTRDRGGPSKGRGGPSRGRGRAPGVEGGVHG